MLIGRDGAPIPRSRLVKDHVATPEGRIVIERLPACGPPRNPVRSLGGILRENYLVAMKELGHPAVSSVEGNRPCRLQFFPAQDGMRNP